MTTPPPPQYPPAQSFSVPPRDPVPPPFFGPQPPFLGPPPPTSPAGQPLAEFSDRLLAYLIDSAILVGASLIFVVPALIFQFSIMMGPMQSFQDRYPPGSTQPDPGQFFAEMFSSVLLPILVLYLVLFLVIIAIRYVYQVEMMFRTGQTVGKRVMRIKIIPLDPDAPLTRAVATRRWLIESVATVFVPFLSYLDGLWQLWDKPYRQCLHDKVARTTVVKVGS